MRESREVQYVLRFNRYYIFWEDHGEPYKEKAAAISALASLKTANPSYWHWKIVERDMIIRETDFDEAGHAL